MVAICVVLSLLVVGGIVYGTAYYVQTKKIKPDLCQVFDYIEKLKTSYISNSDKDTFKELFSYLYNTCKASFIKTEEMRKFIGLYEKFDDNRKKLNKKFILCELENTNELFNNIDGKSLDKQQRIACIVNEDANLIVAGAGSGKTLTICGKIKYLLEKGVKPEDILCISFTNKVCDELMARLDNICGAKIDVMTFHKLGLRFLKQTKKNLSIADENQTEQILEQAFSGARNKDLAIMELNALVLAENYIKEHSEIKSDDEFYTIKNVIDHVRKISELKSYERDSVKLDTLCSERVKSKHELDIANFLFLNGIHYEYERQYKFENEDEFFNYKPDFYLPEYDIYIEHFGIDKSGKATWLKDERRIKDYSDEMNKKIEFHKKNKNKLICTYSYEKDELLSNLYEKLSKNNVKFTPCSSQIIDMINTVGNYEKAIIKTISSFIKLFKNRGYTVSKFDEFLNPLGKYKPSHYERYLLKLIKAVFVEYQEIMQQRNLIDFDDMIIKANKCFDSKNIECGYKYIVVDEYQDVSIGKVDLLKNIIKLTKAKLIAVGDDWQSIYRFAGSEVTLISNFNKYFKHCEIMKIEKTYRNSKQIINVSGGFIQKNDNQIKKSLISDKEELQPIEVISYNEKTLYTPQSISIEEKNELIKLSLNDGRYEPLIKALDKISNNNKKTALLLVRNNDDYSIIRYWLKNKKSGLSYVENPTKQLIFKYKDVEVTCMTMHKSKGLESDAVIIFDLREGYRGLPDTLGDEGILRFVIASVEPIDYAEDRRLFYVALTRTKWKVFIINRLKEQSQFIDEIAEFDTDVVSDIEDYRCPLCNGYLVKIDQYGFYGCSNHIKNLCTYKIKAKNNEELIRTRRAINELKDKDLNMGIFLKGVITDIKYNKAPKGNPSAKVYIDLYYNNACVGDLLLFLNESSGYSKEDYKLFRFIALLGVKDVEEGSILQNIDKLRKSIVNKSLSIDVVSNNYGATFELNKYSDYYFKPVESE